MARFAVFEITDLANAEQVGEILVTDAGAITLNAHAGSSSARRLNTAVDALRKSSSLDLRSESMREGSLVMTIREIRPGESLYAATVTDTLSWRFGFRCVRQEDFTDEAE